MATLYAQRPNSLRQLRACRYCKLIKTMHQFEKELCDNCWSEWTDGASPDETSDAKTRTAAEDNTTDDFVGQVAMLRPDASWVARWLRMHKSASSSSARVPFKPGLYAISLPTDEAQQAQQEEGGGGDDEDDEMDIYDEEDTMMEYHAEACELEAGKSIS